MAEHDDTDFEARHYAKILADADFPPAAAETLGKTISGIVDAARRRWEQQVKYVDTENLIRILEDYAKRQEEFIGQKAADIITAAVDKKDFTEAARAFRTEFATKEELNAAVQQLEQAIKTRAEATAEQVRADTQANLEAALSTQAKTISESISELKDEQSQRHVAQIRWIAGTTLAATFAVLGILFGLVLPLIDK